MTLKFVETVVDYQITKASLAHTKIKNGLVVTVTSPRGGTGKTTTSLATATMLFKSSRQACSLGLIDQPLSVVVVDLDIFDAQLGYYFAKNSPTALNLVSSDIPLNAGEILDNLLYDKDAGIHVLLAPSYSTNSISKISPNVYHEIINHLKTMFDVIILDTAVQYTDPYIKDVALPDSDMILLMTQTNNSSILDVSKWLKQVSYNDSTEHVIKNKVQLVFSQTTNDFTANKDNCEKFFGLKMLVNIPYDAKAIKSMGISSDFKDLMIHPVMGPAYFKIAQKIMDQSNVQLAPLW